MRLTKVTPELFDEIQRAWDEQFKEFEEEVIESYAEPSMEHAKKIVHEGSNGQDYSIFSAKIDGEHACILHVNRARLPDTTGITQKVMWVLLAPRYDFEDIEPEDFARIATTVVYGAIELCQTEQRSAHIKIHIGNIADREFFSGMMYALKESGTVTIAELRGKWLHMTLA